MSEAIGVQRRYRNHWDGSLEPLPAKSLAYELRIVIYSSDVMLNNIHYSLRQLFKSPAFTIVSILTIALGIGANTAVFSVMNAVLLRSLPVPHSEQLVLFHLRNQPLSTTQSGYDDQSLSLPVFQAMRTRQDVFTQVIAFTPLGFGKVPVRFGAEPEEARGEMVSGNYFLELGVQPMIGRGFTKHDEETGAAITVLSYRWWQSNFGGSPSVLGRILYVKGVPLTIVGVAPAGFEGTDPGQPEMDFWLPLQKNTALNPWGNAATDQTLYGSPNWLCLMIIGRLRPGVTAPSAASRLTPLFRQTLAHASPVSPKDQKPELVLSDVRGIETLRDDYERPLKVLMTMVASVLLIACANVAMLLLLRSAGKEREFALRRALGANARVLFAQLISESMLLVGAGCALGWYLALQATQALTRWSGLDFVIQPDRQVLLFAIIISAIIALIFGMIPMRSISNIPLIATLRTSATSSNIDRHRFWSRKLVVSAQIALCTVLLFGGELLYATLRNLEVSDLGLRTAGVLVFGITPPSTIVTDAETVRFHRRILQAIRGLPGVDYATLSAVRLGTGGSYNDGVLVDGRNPLPAKSFAPMRVNVVGSDFLHTLGIPLQAGRDFDQRDIAGSAKTAIINRTFADQYLPHQNPLGHQVALVDDPKITYTIVGVASNSRYKGIRETERPLAYAPFSQIKGISTMQYEVHTSENTKALLPEINKVVHGIDPNIPLENPLMQREQFEHSLSQERLVARLSISFGLLAMFLVLIGLYGTISYSVSRRITEVGIRMALGAQRSEVLGMVLRESAVVAFIGVAVGLPLALALGGMLKSMLFGLSSADPIACITALVGIAIVTVGATVIPARRAASIDPMAALRAE